MTQTQYWIIAQNLRDAEIQEDLWTDSKPYLQNLGFTIIKKKYYSYLVLPPKGWRISCEENWCLITDNAGHTRMGQWCGDLEFYVSIYALQK